MLRTGFFRGALFLLVGITLQEIEVSGFSFTRQWYKNSVKRTDRATEFEKAGSRFSNPNTRITKSCNENDKVLLCGGNLRATLKEICGGVFHTPSASAEFSAAVSGRTTTTGSIFLSSKVSDCCKRKSGEPWERAGCSKCELQKYCSSLQSRPERTPPLIDVSALGDKNQSIKSTAEQILFRWFTKPRLIVLLDWFRPRPAIGTPPSENEQLEHTRFAEFTPGRSAVRPIQIRTPTQTPPRVIPKTFRPDIMNSDEFPLDSAEQWEMQVLNTRHRVEEIHEQRPIVAGDGKTSPGPGEPPNSSQVITGSTRRRTNDVDSGIAGRYNSFGTRTDYMAIPDGSTDVSLKP